jgi:hypothetical protein
MSLIFISGWASHPDFILEQYADLFQNQDFKIIDWTYDFVQNPLSVHESDRIIAWSLGAHFVSQITNWQKASILLINPALDFCHPELGTPQAHLDVMIKNLTQHSEIVLKSFAKKLNFENQNQLQSWLNHSKKYTSEQLIQGLDQLKNTANFFTLITPQNPSQIRSLLSKSDQIIPFSLNSKLLSQAQSPYQSVDFGHFISDTRLFLQ